MEAVIMILIHSSIFPLFRVAKALVIQGPKVMFLQVPGEVGASSLQVLPGEVYTCNTHYQVQSQQAAQVNLHNPQYL
jgi:hypothetical protein